MSNVPNPQSYVTEIDDQLKKFSGDPKKQGAALDAMTEKIKSDDVKKTLAEEVKGLTGMAIQIDEAFEDIRGKLTRAEVQAARDGWVGEVPLVEGWVKLQKQFRELLLRSRKSASDIVFYIDKFNNVVIEAMNDPKVTKEEKQKVIENFMNKKIPYNGREDGLKGGLNDAWDYATEFQNLGRDVTLYAAKFLEVGQKQAGIWNARSKELSDSITQLNLDLEAIQTQIAKWAAVVGVGAAVTTGAGVLFALGPLGPIAAGVVAVAGLIAVGVGAHNLDQALGERTAKEQEKKDKENELAELKEKQAALAKVQLEMTEAVLQAQGIASRLGAFKVIWNSIAFKGRDVLNHINDVSANKELTDFEFKKDIQFTQEGFAILKVALSNYALLIDNSGIKTDN